MLSVKQKKQIEKVCNRIYKKHGLHAAVSNVNWNLHRGSCSLAEYNYAVYYVNKLQ